MRAYGCVIGVFCATIATDGQNKWLSRQKVTLVRYSFDAATQLSHLHYLLPRRRQHPTTCAEDYFRWITSTPDWRSIDVRLTPDWRPIDVRLTSDWRPIDARLASDWRWILRSATLSDAAWSVDAWRLTMNLDIGAANDGDFVSLSCFCRNYQSRIRHWIGMFVRRNERHELGGALSAFLILSMVQNIKRGEWVYDADDGKGVRL